MRKYMFLCLMLVSALVNAQRYSELWGKNGEKWDPAGRLPDFSYAGYHQGEKAIPEVDIVANVKDFGAKGNGLFDDTEAFKKAIAQTENGAILIPEGIYRITDFLEIRKSNLVLRGEGHQKTILYFPVYLNDIEPDWGSTTEGRPTSNYSWSDGFIRVFGNYGQNNLTSVDPGAKRGDYQFEVSEIDELNPGDWVTVKVSDPGDYSLFNYLYTEDPASMDRWNRPGGTSQVMKIENIKGKTVTFNRPLRFDLRAAWSPELTTYQPEVQEVGIENLAFEYPVKPYEGHFSELGYNALAFGNVANCWVKNIRIKNCDSGIFLSGNFCTLDGVIYESERTADPNRLASGHHGIYITDQDNLFTNFVFKTRFVHDITVSHCAGNVISNGGGVDLSLDHHKKAPYANLFTNLNLGVGSQMFRSGGGRELGRHSAGYETFWNIDAIENQQWPEGWGPNSMNLVGLKTNQASILNEDGKWFEAISPLKLFPQNLHQAQLEKRLENK